MTFRNTLFAAAAVLSQVGAHIIMEKPVPYGADTIDNSPITAAQFPCKSSNGFKISEVNKMAVGEQQTLSFKGSAVHNGGLCQLSVALTREPTPDTVFKVVKTIMGGCPGMTGASTFNFELPESIPDGEHTFAWTWMPVSSGQPEYYMNCAPIEVSGGASDDSAFLELPDMLVANLAELTTCKQQENTVLQPPNPGDVVEVADSSKKVAPPTGDCGASGGSPPPNNQPRSSTAQQQPTAAPTAPPSNPGPTGTGGAPAQPQPTGGAPSAGADCPVDGALVCNGPTQFALCNHGKAVWQDVAAGTTCTNGQIQKREYHGRIVRTAV
ncbi:lytic polysaccharide monooxygenase [Sporormia fimetaria CBS 119925]|uniref:Lytic polysaccharide monooxygenase n=1 Tax=Sporormia fimetaria CBS 119925 TaxID=1340428 RepID=A0A6A6VCM3_9PLEO|nr:lytic polysaccharide monooxygenase [Sporormia fimetaria CBS 119925]